MKTLVTGGAGYIGSKVVKRLCQQNRDVRVLHVPGENLDRISGLEVETVAGDITDLESLRNAMEGCSRLFHLAAIYQLWSLNPEAMWEVNVEGTRNVMRTAADLDYDRVVYTSTLGVYGGHGPDDPATETSEYRLHDAGVDYIQSKYEAHQVVDEFAKKGLDVVTVCPAGPIGPGDSGPTPTGELMLTILKMPIVIVPNIVGNIVDVRDVADGHLLAEEHGTSGESYILGGENWTTQKVARMVLEVAGSNRPILPVPPEFLFPAAHLMKFVADYITHESPMMTPASLRASSRGLTGLSTKAKNELGFDPRPPKRAIRDALLWFARNGYVESGTTTQRILRLGST